jgi:molybdate transport system substrate-binding protein
VSVVGTFPEDAHPPIVYPAAAVSDSAAARAFLDWLTVPAARAVFEGHGFSMAQG